MSRDGTNISSIYGLYQSERVNQSCKLSSLDQSDETARRHSPYLTLQRLCCTLPLVTAVHMDAGRMMSNLAWSKMELELFNVATWNRNIIW